MDNPEPVFRERAARFREEERRAEWTSRLISTARLLTFLAAFVLLALGLEAQRSRGLLLGAAGLLGASFLALLAIHERVIRRQEREAGRRRVNEEALARLAHAWKEAPLPEAPA